MGGLKSFTNVKAKALVIARKILQFSVVYHIN